MLSDYSVGGLSWRKKKAVKQHLDSCPECMRELTYLENTASLLDSIPQEEPPDFLWEKVRRKIIQQEQIEKSFLQKIVDWLRWRRIPALATGFAVLILAVGLYFSVWTTPTEQESTVYAEMEQQTFSYWNTSFADRAALGMLVAENSMEGENDETFR